MRNISFGKIAAILAVAFGIGIGTCGFSRLLPYSDQEFQTNVGVLSLLIMALSLVGMVITMFAWAVVSLIRSFGSQDSKKEDRHE